MSRLLSSLLLLAALLIGSITAVFAGEKSTTPFVGVCPGEVTSDVALDYGVQAGQGILVECVVPGSPAEKVGFRTNDVITKLAGFPITGPAEFRTQLKKYKPNESVDITYLRGGKEKTVPVTLTRRNQEDFLEEFKANLKDEKIHTEILPWIWAGSKKHKSKVAFAGIVTQELQDGLADYFKVKKGALISEVVEGSAAEKAGLKAGDVIVKIGNEDIEDEGDVRSAIRDHDPGDNVDFIVYRNGAQMTINVTLGEQYGSNDGKGRTIEIWTDDDELGQVIIETPEPPEPPELPEFPRVIEPDLDKFQEQVKSLRIQLDNLPDMNAKIQREVNKLRASSTQVLDDSIAPQDQTRITIIQPTSFSQRWDESFARLRARLLETYEQVRLEMLQIKFHLQRYAEKVWDVIA
ncbi:PDZ domain-containing protein [candidate division KSB1 bacterium]|nr:MAG: PDZ domain-containing protein [candidate division KSB1 bacterium]